jgi:hypothetical protein
VRITSDASLAFLDATLRRRDPAGAEPALRRFGRLRAS